jgi:hypothetical protein
MTRISALPARTTAALFAALALAGCVKKQPTEVSPTAVPEGTFSAQARLVAYPDVPSTLRLMDDLLPLGQSPEDTLLGTQPIRQRGPGVNYLMLFDGTQASAFEALRREAGGGYFAFKDFLFNPSRKWIDGQREVYTVVDENPSGFSPPTYLMRGVVAGEITPESPLTNPAVVGAPTIGNITYTGPTLTIDSLFSIAWQPVAGAAGYWVQVYQFLEAQQSDQVNSGFPAPAYIGRQRDFFFGYFPSTITSYTLGQSPPDVEIFTRRGTLRGQVYLVRVAAVDANGFLLAYTYGDFGLIPGEGDYTLFPLGAKRIDVLALNPGATSVTPVGGPGARREVVRMGDLQIVRREDL